MTIPSFGEKETRCDLRQSFMVSTLLFPIRTGSDHPRSSSKWGLVLAWREIEAGEDHLQALKRELIEELGFTAVLGQYYGQADEYFYSSHRDTYYYNPAYIYEVLGLYRSSKPLEDFNNLAWFPVDEAY